MNFNLTDERQAFRRAFEALPDDALAYKFRSNCKPVLGVAKCAPLLETVSSLARGRGRELAEHYSRQRQPRRLRLCRGRCLQKGIFRETPGAVCRCRARDSVRRAEHTGYGIAFSILAYCHAARLAAASRSCGRYPDRMGVACASCGRAQKLKRGTAAALSRLKFGQN